MLILDKDIVLAAKNGNLGAFEALLFVCEKPIFNYIYRMVTHRQTAEDLTQETFLRVYKHIGSVDPERNALAWIYTIATNTTYDYLRKRKRGGEIYFWELQDLELETADEHTAVDLITNIEARTDVLKAMENLRVEYKAVLLLFYYHDLPYESIADTLQVPLNTVRTFLHRAKLALKQELLNQPTI
jgi:RNA polymerase sigma-70 factor, ECF subfamily